MKMRTVRIHYIFFYISQLNWYKMRMKIIWYFNLLSSALKSYKFSLAPRAELKSFNFSNTDLNVFESARVSVNYIFADFHDTLLTSTIRSLLNPLRVTFMAFLQSVWRSHVVRDWFERDKNLIHKLQCSWHFLSFDNPLTHSTKIASEWKFLECVEPQRTPFLLAQNQIKQSLLCSTPHWNSVASLNFFVVDGI